MLLLRKGSKGFVRNHLAGSHYTDGGIYYKVTLPNAKQPASHLQNLLANRRKEYHYPNHVAVSILGCVPIQTHQGDVRLVALVFHIVWVDSHL